MEFCLNNKKGLTLVESLIVIGIISIVFSFFVYIWDSVDVFRKARDSKRINDLNALDTAIKSILTTNSNVSLGEENKIYISLPDSNSNCSSYNLTPIYSPYNYVCVSNDNHLKVDGTGWIPINFNLGNIINITNLPIDPLNNKDYFYSYQTQNGKFKLTARLESPGNTIKMFEDGGIEYTLYEVGNNLYLPSPQSGLVGYWNFDEATGTIAIDSSGYGNNGTLVNGPQWTTGKAGGALNFDGVDDYVNVNDSSSLDIINSVTISAWIKINAFSETSGWHNEITSKEWNVLRFFVVQLSHKLAFIENIGGTDKNLEGNTNLLTDLWYYVVAVYDGNYIKIYLNGVEDATPISANGILLTNNNPLLIGKYSNTSLFNGLIDEVRIYNRALSEEEIKAIYEATK